LLHQVGLTNHFIGTTCLCSEPRQYAI